MKRIKRGVRKNTFTPVNWAVECPLHPGELKIEYPIGRGPATSTATEYMAGLFYCPEGGGHTFPLEEAKATVYDDTGAVQASGVALSSFLLF